MNAISLLRAAPLTMSALRTVPHLTGRLTLEF